jgi:iron(III) transport system substrate-binding protein
MKQVLRACILISLCLGGPVFSSQATELTIYTPHGAELLDFCVAAFRERAPEIRVQVLDMGSQEILDRLRAESKHPRADIWFGAPATLFMAAAGEGLLEPYEPTWSKDFPVERRDSQHRWYGHFLTPEIILYNTRAFTDRDAPTSFEALLDPQYRDQLVLREPLASGTMRTIFGALVATAPDERSGLRRLAMLDANTAQYAPNPTLLFQKLARAKAPLTVWNLPDAMLQIEHYGFPFAYQIPEGGTPVLIDAIALVAGRNNVDAARQFYEFVGSAELAPQLAKRFYRIPARSDLDVSQLPEWMSQEIVALPLDWPRLSAEGARWMNIFDREIKGRGARYLADGP